MAKRPEIVIANGADAGRRYTVPAGGLRLGRSSSNDIHLPDEELSRNHC
ncbi:MAG: FHA domain-containing protein, partial [Kiritimatiellae bacterium]|nr:FHA domain-containing protein [Kiritimatiellia bacterium]